MDGLETAYVGLGSNEGNRTSLISEAVGRLGNLPGIKILAVSSLFESAPVGVPGGPFINAVMAIATGMGPFRLLENLMRTEAAMGRKREGTGPSPRNIDLDLLLYGQRLIREKGLVIPHPRILERRFVLEPLAQIAPDLRIPLSEGVFSEAVSGLKDRCIGQDVRRIGNPEDFPAAGSGKRH